ncbi:DUF1015 domain-containing protein [candidate division KSB1 bacterium]|nr:DUF1015 domain-containing protein [candidate division KSB1 bacterium]
MAEVQPFRGFMFNEDKAGSIRLLVSQPYDTISAEMQTRYYQASDYNFARVIKGKEFKSDSASETVYTRANAYLNAWIANDIVRQDDEPAIYAYEQVYEVTPGHPKSRLGYIALLKLENFDAHVVFPHEQTHSGPKVDRYKLMEATHANTGMIFMLYSDPRNAINAILRDQMVTMPALFDFDMGDDITQRIWRINDTDAIQQIQALMTANSLIIADGHHRYETALKFRDDHPEIPGAAYCMMAFINMDDPGLSVLPTHRLFKNLPGEIFENLHTKIENYFNIDSFSIADKQLFLNDLKKQGAIHHTFGLYDGGNKFYSLSIKDTNIINSLFPSDMSTDLRHLDVAIFNEIIVKHVLHIQSNIESHISYSKDGDESIELVDNGNFQLAFFLNPTKISQIKAITSKGERMPQKSTYFYPKLVSGLIFHKLS